MQKGYKGGRGRENLYTKQIFYSGDFQSDDIKVVLPVVFIISVAKCLGARRVAANALEWTKNHTIISHACSDKEAVLACDKFADDHRMLVEPACGAALACVYERLFKVWQEQGKLGELKSALVIVCGGNLVSLKAMKEWKDQLGLS